MCSILLIFIAKITDISTSPYTISAINETALLISFESRIDEVINDEVMSLQCLLELHPFKGMIETVPAYSSLAIFYDVATIRQECPGNSTAFEFVSDYVRKLMRAPETKVAKDRKKTVVIPVFYDGDDLEYVAVQHQLTTREVIQIHSAKTYRVFMIGFLPGFAYMGKVDERIATPRHATPRTIVQAGAVGIAGFQTGIYPMNSPGGWQLIGQTPLKIFDPDKDQPCLLQAGDSVQFASINQQEFKKLNEY